MVGRVSEYYAAYRESGEVKTLVMMHGNKVAQPANYFYAEWIPTKTPKSEYRRTQVNQAVQVIHSLTKQFVEPTQFVNHVTPSGNIELKSLNEAGVYKEFTPDEYRHVQLVITRQIRKVDYDLLPENMRAEEFGFYHEIRAVIDNVGDMRLVNHSQNVLVNSYLTDLGIILHCADLEKFGGNKAFVEEEITREIPALKGVLHPEKERLLGREAFYAIKLTGRMLLFDILENYIGSYNIVGQYMPSNFSELISQLGMTEIRSVRIQNIDYFLQNVEGRRWRRGY